jgi:hypothetical protein
MAPLFFGENPPTWTDMSNYVVHFTKNFNKRSAYNNMLSILQGRQLTAISPFGIAHKEAPDQETQKAVCFSEVPLHRLGRICRQAQQVRDRIQEGFRDSQAWQSDPVRVQGRAAPQEHPRDDEGQ